jgi:hypothetical protein
MTADLPGHNINMAHVIPSDFELDDIVKVCGSYYVANFGNCAATDTLGFGAWFVTCSDMDDNNWNVTNLFETTTTRTNGDTGFDSFCFSHAFTVPELVLMPTACVSYIIIGFRDGGAVTGWSTVVDTCTYSISITKA